MTDTTEHEPPSLAERYGLATQSSHLRVETAPCDADMIIAAGKASSPLGALLWRLRREFDAARVALRAHEVVPLAQAAQDAERAASTAMVQWHAPRVVPPEVEEATRVRSEWMGYAQTERAMVMMELRSLHACKQQLWAEVITWLSGARAIEIGKEDAAQVTGRVLDAWLDANCPGCDGRKFNGGTHRGEQKVTCRACRGSGQRRTGIARDTTQRLLADRIFNTMSEAMFTTEVEMRTLLRDQFSERA